jgi:enoyl-CoA hydratase/carnithine racemase
MIGDSGLRIRRDELEPGIVQLTLDAPGARNAIDDAMAAQLVEEVGRLGADESVRCVILTGAGEAFCAGGNVKDMLAGRGMFGGSSAQMRQAYRAGIQNVPLALHNLEVPVIAAVNGVAVGAGLDLSLMCDLRIAAEGASFAESFVRLGLISGDGGAWLLQRAIGPARAAQLTLTAQTIDAAAALAWGLVSEVVPAERLLPRALVLARVIAAHPPLSVRMNKRLLRDSAAVPLATALEFAAALQAVAQHTEDHREALRAFADKRPPRFVGR